MFLTICIFVGMSIDSIHWRQGKDGMGLKLTLLLSPGRNTVFKSHFKEQLPTMKLYIIKGGGKQKMTCKDRAIFRDIICTPRKPWQHHLEKSPCYIQETATRDLSSFLATVTILQRTKIFQNIALFFLSGGSYRCMGLWGRPNKSVLQRHSGFFVFLKPISYNNKGKRQWCIVLARKKITDQTVSSLCQNKL